jgi:hypothetical protein
MTTCLREECLVVAVAGRPVHHVGRRAALAVDRGVGVDRHDQPAPDLRVVDDEPAIGGHVVRIIGSQELEELIQRVAGLARHAQTDAPEVVAAHGPAHCGRHLVAPERPERVPLLGDVSEGEPRLLQEAFPDMDVVRILAHRQPV